MHTYVNTEPFTLARLLGRFVEITLDGGMISETVNQGIIFGLVHDPVNSDFLIHLVLEDNTFETMRLSRVTSVIPKNVSMKTKVALEGVAEIDLRDINR